MYISDRRIRSLGRVTDERRSNEERTRTTRAALLAAARQHFEREGYAATRLDAVVADASVTKGALYHHFPTKQALYEAVIVAIQDELTAHVDRSARKARTAWDKVVDGFLSFIEIAPEAGMRRLMLEAPTVLGYERWREIDDERNLPAITASLARLEAKGELAFPATVELAETLLAISNALGTLVAEADDPATARDHVLPVWEHLIRSLRRPASD